MQRGLKYIKLFESQSLKDQFLETFSDKLADTYARLPEVAFAVWKHLSHDKGRVDKLRQIGLFDESKHDDVRRLPNIDKIVGIYGRGFIETEPKAQLLNRMCDSIVTAFYRGNGVDRQYEIHLDEDHLVDQETVETLSFGLGGRTKLTSCKTLSGVPLLIVERMGRLTIWLNVDDLDKMKPWS